MHDSSATVILFAKQVGSRDSKGLRGYACDYATRLIARVPRGDGDGFCRATTLLSTGYAVPLSPLQD
jgi:hypothetical protein